MYTNAEHNLSGYIPIIGNLTLEPMKTVSSEFSYKRLFANDWVFVFTGFIKQYDNLVDSQAFLLPDSLITANLSTVGFAKYSGTGRGTTKGLEITLQKRLSNHFSGRISYTLMNASGTSTKAETGFQNAVYGGPEQTDNQFPLSWDQRHTFIFNAGYESRRFNINALYRLLSPLPVTAPNSITPNDQRLSWRNVLDFKFVLKPQSLLSGNLKPFFEVRNVFDEKNIFITTEKTGASSYRLFDPMNSQTGRLFRIGLTLDY
jgi:hypothetical protein